MRPAISVKAPSMLARQMSGRAGVLLHISDALALRAAT